MPFIAWLGIVVALAIALIFLERTRQIRKLRERGEQVSDRPNLLGAGVLEMQRLLEPERKVEILQQEAKGEESGETEQDDETDT